MKQSKKEIEELAERLHYLYYEALKKVNPKVNPVSYNDLTEEHKEIDRYIAKKILGFLSKKQKKIDELKKVLKDKLGNECDDEIDKSFNEVFKNEITNKDRVF